MVRPRGADTGWSGAQGAAQTHLEGQVWESDCLAGRVALMWCLSRAGREVAKEEYSLCACLFPASLTFASAVESQLQCRRKGSLVDILDRCACVWCWKRGTRWPADLEGTKEHLGHTQKAFGELSSLELRQASGRNPRVKSLVLRTVESSATCIETLLYQDISF